MIRSFLGAKFNVPVETHRDFDFEWDDSLVEVLCRLPNEKLSALRAKCKLERRDKIF